LAGAERLYGGRCGRDNHVQAVNTDYILGMAKMGGGVKILLDIDPVLSDQEIEVLENAA
jgi:hypothetical protein